MFPVRLVSTSSQEFSDTFGHLLPVPTGFLAWDYSPFRDSSLSSFLKPAARSFVKSI